MGHRILFAIFVIFSILLTTTLTAQEVNATEEDIPFPTQWGGTGSAEAQSNTIMPDWFKTNAKWWQEGLITDTDMINGLESLIIQDVIPLDRFVTSSYSGGGYAKQATQSQQSTQSQQAKGYVSPYSPITPSIPSYQKDVFGFWSDGAVSDSEIVNSIGHLMSEGIISSEKIKKEITERQEKYQKEFGTSGLDDRISREGGIDSRSSATVCEDDHVCDTRKGEACAKRTTESSGVCIPTWFGINHDWNPSTDGEIFETAKQNELSMKYLQKIKAAEYENVKNFYDSAVDDYSKNKDQDTMNIMNNLGNAEKIAKEESLQATQILKTAVQSAKDAKDAAVKSGLDILDLEKSVSTQQSEIDSMNRHFTTESEMNSAYKDAQKSQRLSNDGLQKTLSSVMENDPRFQELTSTDKNFVSTTINGIDYSDFKGRNDYLPPGYTPKNISPLDFSTFPDSHIRAIEFSRIFQSLLLPPDYSWNTPGHNWENTDEWYDPQNPTNQNPTNQDATFRGEDDQEIIESDGKFYQSPDGTDSSVSDRYNVEITMPDGTTVVLEGKFPEKLEKILNKDIIEGHKKIEKGPPSDTPEKSDVPVEDSNNNDNTSTIPPNDLSAIDDYGESKLTEPRDKLADILDDYGIPTVIGPYAEYSTGKWTIFVDGDIFYYDTQEKAQGAFDELKDFANDLEIEVNYDTIDDENSKDVDSNTFALNHSTIHDIDEGDYLVYRGTAIPGDEVIIWLYNVETLDKITNTVSVDINGNWYHQQYVDVAGEYFTNFASGDISMTSPQFTVHGTEFTLISNTVYDIEEGDHLVFRGTANPGDEVVVILYSEDAGYDFPMDAVVADINGKWFSQQYFDDAGTYVAYFDSENTRLTSSSFTVHDSVFTADYVDSPWNQTWDFRGTANPGDEVKISLHTQDGDLLTVHTTTAGWTGQWFFGQQVNAPGDYVVNFESNGNTAPGYFFTIDEWVEFTTDFISNSKHEVLQDIEFTGSAPYGSEVTMIFYYSSYKDPIFEQTVQVNSDNRYSYILVEGGSGQGQTSCTTYIVTFENEGLSLINPENNTPHFYYEIINTTIGVDDTRFNLKISCPPP